MFLYYSFNIHLRFPEKLHINAPLFINIGKLKILFAIHLSVCGGNISDIMHIPLQIKSRQNATDTLLINMLKWLLSE